MIFYGYSGYAKRHAFSIIDDWANYYETVVKAVVFDPLNRSKLNQWVTVARLPFDRADYLNSVQTSAKDVLRYNVVNSIDASATLGGFPYDNSARYYRASANDFLLNILVQRFTVDPTALQEMRDNYNTSGQLDILLVTIHTRLDQQVPYLHQELYTRKTLVSGDLGTNHMPIAVDRYGHCNFELQEILTALFVMLQLGGGF